MRKYNGISAALFKFFRDFPAAAVTTETPPMPDSPAPPATHSDLVNAIRALAMDAVQKANSGHPGMPMGMAEIAEVLWRRFLRHNPANPGVARSRPIRALQRPRLDAAVRAAAPHGLRPADGGDPRFRQLHSKTPGHPEHGLTPGVETTTGPLGQGLANAVGMALAEQLLAAEFNRPGHDDRRPPHLRVRRRRLPHGRHLARGLLARGDAGARQAHRALRRQRHLDRRPRRRLVQRQHAEALRGLRLARDRRTSTATTSSAIDARDRGGEGGRDRPTLICCKTVIGKGAPNKAGTDAHGARARRQGSRRHARGDRLEARALRDSRADSTPPGTRAPRARSWKRRGTRSSRPTRKPIRRRRRRSASACRANCPPTGRRSSTRWSRKAHEKGETVATRKASQQAIEALAPHLPGSSGGSADLTGSNLTNWSGTKAITRQAGGQLRVLRRARVRHGGGRQRPGTPRRLHPLLGHLPHVLGLLAQRAAHGGADEAAEASSSSRTIPSGWARTDRRTSRSSTSRACASFRAWTSGAPATRSRRPWPGRRAIERRDGPSSLALSRQNSPFVKRSPEALAAIRRGGYVISEAAGAR